MISIPQLDITYYVSSLLWVTIAYIVVYFACKHFISTTELSLGNRESILQKNHKITNSYITESNNMEKEMKDEIYRSKNNYSQKIQQEKEKLCVDIDKYEQDLELETRKFITLSKKQFDKRITNILNKIDEHKLGDLVGKYLQSGENK